MSAASADGRRKAITLRHQASSAVMVSLAVTLAALTVSSMAKAIAGDCDGDERVTLDEVIRAVDIALGQQSVNTCERLDADRDGTVSVDELVRAVDSAIGFQIEVSGRCVQPGSANLTECDGGEVRLLRCDDADRSRCLGDSSLTTTLDSGSVDDGGFTLSLSSLEAASASLIVEAVVAEGVGYRTIGFGFLSSIDARTAAGGAGAGERDPASLEVLLSPSSEAAVRIIDENDFATFSDQGVLEINDAVVRANADLNFAGKSAAEGATVAVDDAREDPGVLAAIACNQFLLADSVQQFSMFQGDGGWFYGYMIPPSEDFVSLPSFDGASGSTGAWQVEYGMFWTSIRSSGTHPNGRNTSQGRSPVEQWTVRRWISAVSGRATICAHLADENANCGDGVTARIVSSGASIWERALSNGGTLDERIELELTDGKPIDFIVTPGPQSDDTCDGTQFYVKVVAVHG